MVVAPVAANQKEKYKHKGSVANGLKLSKKEYSLLNGLYTGLTYKHRPNPTAFTGVTRLKRASGLSYGKVKDYLASKDTYTKYKTPVRKFNRLKSVSPAINEIWSVDLAYVDKLSYYNDGVKYLMIAVDVLSRFLRVQTMKNKTALTAKHALQKMFDQRTPKGVRGKPRKIWVDEGTEFLGKFKEFCIEEDITIYSTFSETKSAIAERYIRTFKNELYKYLEERSSTKKRSLRSTKHSHRYVDDLQEIVDVINSRVNRAILMAPAMVTPNHSTYLLQLQQDASSKLKRNKFKLRIGDKVRVAKEDIPFRKGYKQQFTDEIFVIERIASNNPPTYALRTTTPTSKTTANATDSDGGVNIGDVIKGKFYENELVKVSVVNWENDKP